MTTIFAALGLFLSIVMYEHDLKDEFKQDLVKYPDPMDHPRNKNSFDNSLGFVIWFLSLLSILSLFSRHYYRNQWINNFFLRSPKDPLSPILS